MTAGFHILQNQLHQIAEACGDLDRALAHYGESLPGDEQASGFVAECAQEVVDLVKSFKLDPT